MQTKRHWIHNAARWLTLAVVCCLIVPNFGPGAAHVAHAQPVAPPMTSEAQFSSDGMFGENMATLPTLPAETLPATVHAADVTTQVGDTYTWMQDSRADWEQGTLENLDSAAVSGTLQLAQRYFSTNEAITPREELASTQYSPDIAVDTAGNAYAVWADYRNENTDIYFAYRPAGGEWEANVKVNDDTGTVRQFSPAIAVDNAGNAYAVWQDDRGEIYFAYRPTGGMWGGNVKINGSTEGETPAIAVDDAGNVYVVWSNDHIYFTYCQTGGAWSTPVRINDNTGVALLKGYDLAVDDLGNVYVVWADDRNSQYDIYFAVRSAEGVWSVNTRVNDDIGTTGQYYPAIAADSTGSVYIVWQDGRNVRTYNDIYSAFRSAAGVWSTNAPVDNTGEASGSPPDVAMDSAGNAYAVWMASTGGNWNIYFAFCPTGGVWGDKVQVNPSVYGMQEAPAIAVSNAGDAYAVWTDYRHFYMIFSDIYSAVRSPGGTWNGDIRVNDDPKTRQSSPDIAVDDEGNAYAIWHDNRNGNYDIYFAYRPIGGVWGTNIKVNDDVGTEGQWSPAIAVDRAGNACAVWEDERNGNRDIYFA